MVASADAKSLPRQIKTPLQDRYAPGSLGREDPTNRLGPGSAHRTAVCREAGHEKNIVNDRNSKTVSIRPAWILIALLLSIVCASLAAAATHHVAPTGDDMGGDGSELNPWRQIRQALTLVEPGDTVLVADGSYLGFTVSGLGSTASPIVIKAPGRKAEILPTSDRGGQYDADNIAVWNSTNIVIDGLRSFGAARAAVRIVWSNQITIRNGVYGNNGSWAIVTTHADDAVVESCDLYGSRAEHGIYFANGGDRPIARGNRIHHNFGSGIRAYGDIEQGGDGLISGAIFENNTIYSNYGGAGMNLNAFKDAIIRNNLIYDNHASSGIALFLGEGGIGVGNIEIHHNTIDVPADGKYNLRILSVQAPISIRDNIFYNRTPTRGLYSFGAPADAALTNGDYNIVGGALFVSDDDQASRTSWADWQAGGREAHSQVSTPDLLFVDSNAADYRLRAGSPAVDTGLTLPSANSDRDGAPRPMGLASDVGAHEFLVVTPPDCGDGSVQGGLGEACDDGNRINGDCCSATCQAEATGNPCRHDDICAGDATCDGAGICAVTTPTSCTDSFPNGTLTIDERSSGREALSINLKRGSALVQPDFGDPRTNGGTDYTLCVYDDGDALVGRLEIDRAGESCGSVACWKALGNPPRGSGYRYLDATLSTDGVQSFQMKGGAAGRPSLLLKAKNNATAGQTNLPPGLAAALADSTNVTLKVFGSDATGCVSATLATTSGSSTLFQASR